MKLRNIPNRGYLLIYVIVYIFFIMKMQRAFSGSEQQGGLWNVIQLFLVLYGLAILLMKERHVLGVPPVRYITLLSALAVTVSLFTMRYDGFESLFHLLMLAYGAMSLVVFHRLGRKIDLDVVRLLPAVFYIIALMIFVALRSFRVFDERVIGAIADVYYVLGLLPLVLALMRQKTIVWQLLPIFATLIVILMTGKRGGLIALAIGSVIYFMSMRSKAAKKSGFTIILLVGVVAVGTYFIYQGLEENYGINALERMEKLEEDGGSGRLDRWLVLLNIHNYPYIYDIIFGHGYGATVELLRGGHAHNDFLEILYNYGIVALVLYVAFFVSLIKIGIKMYRTKYRFAPEYTFSVIIALVLSNVSFYFIEPTYITCGVLSWGVFIADWEKQLSGCTNKTLL